MLSLLTPHSSPRSASKGTGRTGSCVHLPPASAPHWDGTLAWGLAAATVLSHFLQIEWRKPKKNYVWVNNNWYFYYVILIRYVWILLTAVPMLHTNNSISMAFPPLSRSMKSSKSVCIYLYTLQNVTRPCRTKAPCLPSASGLMHITQFTTI